MIFWFRVHGPLMMCMACQCAVSWIWYMCTVKVSLEIISVLLHVSLSVWLVLELEVYRVLLLQPILFIILAFFIKVRRYITIYTNLHLPIYSTHYLLSCKYHQFKLLSQITHVARLSTPKQIINWDLLLIYEHMLYWARATIWGNLFSRALDRRREDWSRVFRMDSNSRCTGLKCPPPPQYICPAGHVGLGQNFLRSRFSVDRLLKTELIWFCVEHLFPSEYP